MPFSSGWYSDLQKKLQVSLAPIFNFKDIELGHQGNYSELNSKQSSSEVGNRNDSIFLIEKDDRFFNLSALVWFFSPYDTHILSNQCSCSKPNSCPQADLYIQMGKNLELQTIQNNEEINLIGLCFRTVGIVQVSITTQGVYILQN